MTQKIVTNLDFTEKGLETCVSEFDSSTFENVQQEGLQSEAWIRLQAGITGHREFRLEDISWIRETTTSQSQGQKLKAWKILRNKGLF